MIAQKTIYAFADHPIINAAVNGLFSFTERQKAQERLDSIREQFIISRKIADEDKGQAPTALWIKNYSITEKEEKNGYLGNFAILYIDDTKYGTFTIRARKIKQEAKYHPHRERPKHDHPNWGHPILRYINKGKEYGSIKEANDDLRKLHEEFPDATIPSQNRLFVMIFGKKEGKKAGITKCMLDIVAADGGGFTITCKEQADKKPKKATAKKVEKQTAGKFSSAEALKKSKKSTPIIERKEKASFLEKIDKK